jgi:hypothetical protein
VTQSSPGTAAQTPGLPSTGATRRRRAPLLALLGVVLLAGCGIRTTSVPVDAGPAPSRVSCAVPDEEATTPASASASPGGGAVFTLRLPRRPRGGPADGGEGPEGPAGPDSTGGAR